MPLYEFHCDKCGKEYTELRNINDAGPSLCPGCSSDKTKRKISLFSGGKTQSGCGHSHSSGGG
jgi:putative FmdB family regulatory protein